MNIQQYRTHPIDPPNRVGWRVLTKFQALPLWSSGCLFAGNIIMLAWGLDDGRPLVRMMAPMLGTAVAIGIAVQVLWWSPRPEDYEAPDA